MASEADLAARIDWERVREEQRRGRSILLDEIDPPAPAERPTIELSILAALEGHTSRVTAVHKPELLRQVTIDTGYEIKERELRAAIQELRSSDPRGALIMSSSGGQGYWIAKDLDEVREHYREERGRALSILVRIRKQLSMAEKRFDELPPVQRELFQ
jgi:hypothetical protein